MQKSRMSWLLAGAAAIAMGCASQPAPYESTTTVSSGDVALTDGTGVWLDSLGSVWVEPTGILLVGPGGTRIYDLEPVIVHTMTDGNVAGHLLAGDSAEIALSAIGASRGQNADVRNFGQRMVNEHTAHLDMTRLMLKDAKITAVRAPFDTADANINARMMDHIAASGNTTDAHFDKKFMAAEVAMHQHMLSDLDTFRAQASPAAMPLLNHTRDTVKQHLLDARRLYRMYGGKP